MFHILPFYVHALYVARALYLFVLPTRALGHFSSVLSSVTHLYTISSHCRWREVLALVQHGVLL